jgi:very-short-patch-repair endonuclease
MTSKTEVARKLRRRQTDAERVLWFRVRDRRLGGWKFRRQMDLNGYVVDFCCPDARLLIELDGGQHGVSVERDAKRTTNLEATGYLMLRFWNNDVMNNIDGVLEEILKSLKPQPFEPPHPNPLPLGERERA